MDANMDDVSSANGFSDSDDWGTPRKAPDNANFNVDVVDDGGLLFGDLVQDTDDDEDDVVRPRQPAARPGAEKSKKVAKKPAKKAVRFSHSGDDDTFSPPTPPAANNRASPRNRNSSTSLFVGENEDDDDEILVNAPAEPLIVKGSTALTYPSHVLHRLSLNNMDDGLTRARAIKAQIENNIPVLQAPDKITLARPTTDDDKENQEIKTLRADQNKGWAEIASYLNIDRLNRGEAANLTAQAVYSRYVRSSPKVPIPVNELGFDPKDYQHLRHPNQYSTLEGTGMISKAGKKRVKNYDNAKELESNMRKTVAEDEYGDLETAEKTEQLMEAVAKVERNFWTLVADELERATTKLYPAGRLADRYHAI